MADPAQTPVKAWGWVTVDGLTACTIFMEPEEALMVLPCGWGHTQIESRQLCDVV